MYVSLETNRGDGDPRELGPLSAGAGAVAACHYPAGGRVEFGKRVVTGRQSGLAASRAKGFAKKIVGARVMTRC